MASQLVFLLDLDACVSLGEEDTLLRRSIQGILASESRWSPSSHKMDLPSFALRFYSSSGFFGGRGEEEELSYRFKDLSHDSLECLERLLEDRISQLSSGFRVEAWMSHLKARGTPSAVIPLSVSLDALARHCSWDRPLLGSSPLKKNRHHSIHNAVYVFTALPNNKTEYKERFHKEAKSYTVKELSDKLLTRSVAQKFKQEVTLFIADLAGHSQQDPAIKELFQKALKPIKNGGVLSLADLQRTQSLSPCLVSHQELRGNKTLATDFMLNGTSPLPAFPIGEGGTYSPPTSGETLQLLGMFPGEWFTHQFRWEEHYVFRHYRAVARRVLLFRVGDHRAGVLFENGTLSLLEAKESRVYLDLLEKEDPSPPSQILLKTVDACIEADNGKARIALESPSWVPENSFSDVDLETWRLGCELEDMSRKISSVKKKKKPEWTNLLKNMYASQDKKEKRRRGSVIMERNDSGFSEGKKSSSSTSLNRRLSDESIGVRTRRGSQPIASRAAELLRLGNQKNAENKRRRSLNKSASAKVSSEPFSFPFNDQRAIKRSFYENDMSNNFDNNKAPVSQILAKLMEFQVECINEGDVVSMSALAEITISSLLKYLTRSGEKKANLVSLVSDNFLVDPLTISRRKTSQKMPKRLRDHKLQVLYRMELHWLLSSSEEQEKFENEILIHLRQISIWGSPEDMASFLNEALTPMYVDRQPELLCSLYDELNQPKAEVLRGIFSPSAKSDCSSIAPSSVVSQSSEASLYSSKNPSCRSYSNNNSKSVVNLRKVRRPNMLDQGQLRQIAHPHLKTTASVLAKKPTCNIKEHGLVPSVTASPSSKGRAGLHRAKRNLSFDGLGKSPRKKPSTPRKKAETPKKKVPATPKRMTPNKTHCIYAPETPKNKSSLHNRKSDGLITIHESPDIDSLKTAKTTPRRIRASLNLHRKTSFYSGDVSRNLMKAEENVNASKIRRTSSFPQPFVDESSCDSTAGYLFQHIIRKRSRTEEDEETAGVESRHKIRRIENEDDDDIFSEPSSSPMKTPKKRSFKTPVKESPSPSKKVQFNMRHQPPTPSRGTPAKTILKTPSKEPKTPTSHAFGSPSIHASPNVSSSQLLSNRSMRKKRILFEESPSKPPRLLLGPSKGGSSTKKKIDFEEKEEIEIPDSHLDNIVQMSKVSMTQSERFLDEEVPPPISSASPLEKSCSSKSLLANEAAHSSTTPTKLANPSESLPSSLTTGLEEIEVKEEENASNLVLRPIQVENNVEPKSFAEELGSEYENIISDNLPLKRTNRCRKTTQRLGIDDVPLIGTPSPVRTTNKSASKGSAIRRNLFAPSEDIDENNHSDKRRKTTRSRATTQRFGIDDITLNEALISPLRSKAKGRKSLMKVMNVKEPLETIVDGFGAASEESEESETKSPVKHWSVTGISESPLGEIKLKINRTPAMTQRISRSLVSEIGVSPDRLRRLLTDTPSPKKPRIYSGEDQQQHQQPPSQKYSPLSSMSLIELTTSPILDKNKPRIRNKKVNKRLYID